MKIDRIAIVLFILSVLFVMPHATTQQEKSVPIAKNVIVIEVVENLPSAWNVNGAVHDLDRYTASDMRIVKKCTGKNRCVIISNKPVAGSPVGWSYTCRPSKPVCQIDIDVKKSTHPKRAKYWRDAATKRWLIRHELGHFFGLGHRAACDSTMNHYVRCNGKVPPNKFTKAEQAILRRR